MLTTADESNPATAAVVLQDRISANSAAKHRQLAKMLRVEWLGQMAASLCWIASVLAYGISTTGDWLQLCAASAWLVANIAVVASPESD